MVTRVTGNLGAQLAFEPGRCIVGNAGILVARVLYVKEGATRRFVILDAAMNDLIRPALYDAWHEIVPVDGAGAGRRIAAPPTWSGRCARPATSSPRNGKLPPLARRRSAWRSCRPAPMARHEFRVQFAAAGARSAGARAREFAVVRPRPTYDEMLAQERVPPWLAER